MWLYCGVYEYMSNNEIYPAHTTVKKGLHGKDVEHYRHILERDPYNAEAHFLLGHAYCSCVWSDMDFSLLVKASGEFKQAGRILLKSNNLEDSKSALAFVLKLKGNDAEAHFLLGVIFHDSRQLEEAQLHYEMAISLNPKDAKAHNNLGILYSDKGMLNDALSEYHIALKLDPHKNNARFNLALAHYKLGQHKKSIEVYREVIKLNPLDSHAHFNLALSYYHTREVSQAAKRAELAKKLGFDNQKVEQLLLVLSKQSPTQQASK